MRLGMDLDGVVCNYAIPLIQEFSKRHNHHYSLKDVKTFGLSDIGGTEKEICDIVKQHQNDGTYRNLRPIRGAIKGLKEIHKNSSIHIITYREGKARADTITWLEEKGVPYDTITFTKDKSEFCNLLYLDRMVDDYVDFIDDIVKKAPQTLPIIFTQPWNKDYNNDDVIRITGWKTLTNFLK
jgi:uncharacterized HAD superfamily protein